MSTVIDEYGQPCKVMTCSTGETFLRPVPCDHEFSFERGVTLYCNLPLIHVGPHEARGVRWWGTVRFPADKRYRP